MTKLLFLIAFSLALAAVGVRGVLGADPPKTVATETDDLSMELRIWPRAVDAGSSFEIDLRLRNHRLDSLVLASRATCLAYPAAYDDEDPLWMPGMHNGCVSRPDTFRIGPGEELRERWEVKTETGEGGPVPAGVYSVRMHLNVPDLPELVGRIRIR